MMGIAQSRVRESDLGKVERARIVEADSGIPGFGDSGRLEVRLAKRRAYDLQLRLVRLGAAISKIAGALPSSRIATHISGQLLRCGMAPAPNYAEASACESRRDFIHKLKICLKELRETLVWLEYLNELELGPRDAIKTSVQETNELISIFVVSIATARKNDKKPPKD